MPFDCGYMSLGLASDPPQVASGGVGGDYLVKAWTPCNRGHLVRVTIGVEGPLGDQPGGGGGGGL